jgi:hypothetical protein
MTRNAARLCYAIVVPISGPGMVVAYLWELVRGYRQIAKLNDPLQRSNSIL